MTASSGRSRWWAVALLAAAGASALTLWRIHRDRHEPGAGEAAGVTAVGGVNHGAGRPAESTAPLPAGAPVTGAVTTLTFVFPPPRVVPGEGGLAVEIDGLPSHGGPGEPLLPLCNHPLPGLPGLTYSATVLTAEWVKVEGGPFILARAPQAGARGARPRGPSLTPSVCRPESVVQVVEAWMGPAKLSKLVISPVQYEPADGTLTALRALSLRLETGPSAVPESNRGPLQ